MKINKITRTQLFTAQNSNSKKKENSFLERFYTGVKNSADMTDTLIVPRTIFKGYLGIMTGTTLITAGSLIASRFSKLGKGLSLAGLFASLYGTYAFVRPYILKDAPGVMHGKELPAKEV